MSSAAGAAETPSRRRTSAADKRRASIARDHGVEILLDAWADAPPERRAARIVAQGDVLRAAAYGGGGWKKLAEGEALAALRAARRGGEENMTAPMRLLEAEALLGLGAIVAGLQRLEALHRAGDVAGTLAFARRCHLLGDHARALRAASTLPMNAHAALLGARAAVTLNKHAAAWRLIEPFLVGAAPVPEPGVASGIAVAAATILAKLGRHREVLNFAKRLISAGDLPEDMMPAVGRTAWVSGLARTAWERFSADNPWMKAARLELATLAGDLETSKKLLEAAGNLGAPAAPAVLLLNGGPPEEQLQQDRAGVFQEGSTIHLWRTHPTRWQPWIDAALQKPNVSIEVFDLSRDIVPDPGIIPDAVLDDGSLLGVIAPIPVAPRPVGEEGKGVWIESELCRGVGVGHDWPAEETAVIRDASLGGPAAPDRDSAAIAVVSAESALAEAEQGRPLVVIATPGDPFWAGALPERVWPAMRVMRQSPRTGWQGVGAQVVEIITRMLSPDAPPDTSNEDGAPAEEQSPSEDMKEAADS